MQNIFILCQELSKTYNICREYNKRLISKFRPDSRLQLVASKRAMRIKARENSWFLSFSPGYATHGFSPFQSTCQSSDLFIVSCQDFQPACLLHFFLLFCPPILVALQSVGEKEMNPENPPRPVGNVSTRWSKLPLSLSLSLSLSLHLSLSLSLSVKALSPHSKQSLSTKSVGPRTIEKIVKQIFICDTFCPPNWNICSVAPFLFLWSD